MNILQPLGVCTVTGTKDTNTGEIMVYVPLLFPQADGRNSAEAKQVERTTKNAYGEDVSSNSLKGNSVPATWKRMGDSNRMTSPDVREGSKVAVYTIVGSNTYYWNLDGVDQNTFRLETVISGYSANPNLDVNTEFNVDDYYITKVDTRTGVMSARTAMANGEPTRFDVIIDGQNGTVSVAGNNESLVKIDDIERSFTYTNQDKAVFSINKTSGTFYLPDSLNLFTDKVINVRTKKLNIQADEAFVDIGVTKWKGKFEHTGDTEQLGNYTQEGVYDHTGNYKQLGNTNRTGNSTTSGYVRGLTDVRTMTVSLNIHPHGGVMRGGGSTDAPTPTLG